MISTPRQKQEPRGLAPLHQLKYHAGRAEERPQGTLALALRPSFQEIQRACTDTHPGSE